jgi:DNA replication protein DnaC
MENQNMIGSFGNKRFCEYCGKEMNKYGEIMIDGQIKRINFLCDCYIKAFDKEQEEEKRKARRLYLERFFANSEMGRRFENCSLLNFQVLQGTEESYEATKEFIGSFDDKIKEGSGIVFLGTYGNGKTHLASAIYNHAKAKEYPAIFHTMPTLMMRFNRTYKEDDETEYDLVDLLIEADLLVLDDMGAEKWSEKVQERLFAILSGRYNHKKSTVITANFISLEEMENHIGGRAFDRLVERCDFVVNKAKSYRVEIAKLRRII